MNTVHDELQVVLLAVMFAGAVSCGNTASIKANRVSMEGTLKATLAGGEVPPDLVITYDDMHGLWGGTAIVIRGSGSGGRRERARGDAAPEVFETTIPREQLLELVKLLIEHEAWEQRTPDRQPVPDESRATLTVSVGGQESRVWEWYNEMAKNARLIQIKTKMKEMTR